MRLAWNRLAVLMVAAVFVGTVVAQFPGGGGRGGTSLASLLSNKSVQDELKMTEDQVTKVKTLVDGVRGGFKEELDKAGKKGNPELTKKISEATTEAIVKEGEKLLKAPQMKRLKEIEIQQLGLGALTRESIQKDLKLTDAQVTKIKGVSDDMGKEMQEAFKGAGGDFKKIGEATTKIRASALEKANEVLTDTQRKQLKEMQGEKFELKRAGPGA